jgi:PPK2 family polyphosphate:nucleotide phosphotransferase
MSKKNGKDKKHKKDKKDKKHEQDHSDEQTLTSNHDGGLGAEVAQPEELVGDGHPAINYPRYRVEPGSPVHLSDVNPDESEHYENDEDVADELEKLRLKLEELQSRLFAENKQSLLIVLQAMDTGGKDGTIKSVFAGLNPQGCQVWPFKVPSEEERAHDFLWRCHSKTPRHGMITIFNRSHYEDVLVVRVHDFVPKEVWEQRYDQINQLERILSLNNTVVIKFYLHISKAEQKERMLARIQTPDKRWKFSSADLPERARWDDYMAAYEDAINRCSTDYAPWYVVPSNKKWYRNLVIARAITDTLEAMNPQYPQPEEDLEKIVIPD